jgi:predicted nuclease with TOPRIM domain
MSNCPVGYTCPLIDEALQLHEQLVSQVENLISGDFRNLVHIVEILKDMVEEDHRFKEAMEEIRSANEQLRDWGHEEEENVKEAERELSNCEDKLGDVEQALQEREEEIRDLQTELSNLEK